MKKKMFILQEKLEEILAAKQAILSGCSLSMVNNGLQYNLVPAVKFLACETDIKDPLSLVGKISSHEKLTKEGAEIFLSSLIFREQSYKIEQGYICNLEGE